MKRNLVILVLALQTVWLLATVVQQETLRHRGRVILLATRPVDPRDPLRGDFVRLNFEISEVPTNLLAGPATPPAGRTSGVKISVALAPAATNGFWEITRASWERFAPAANEVILYGHSAWSWGNNPQSVHVTYGIEQFFVAEGTGNPHGKLTAQAIVSPAGRAILKDVLVDGKPYREAVSDTGR